MAVANIMNNNFPTLARKDLMSLSTISATDEKTRPFKKLDTSRDWSINLFNLDIAGTIPKRFGIFTNKTDFINKVDDIERTNSKLLHYPLDKPEYNLRNKDIERSSPNMGHLKTNRCCDPLQPKYSLPKVEVLPMEPPKFLRDAIQINDIAGAKPKRYFKWETRETFPLDNHGIEGTKTKKKYTRSTKYENIDYSDLTKDNFRTTRHVHPLDPVYDFKNQKTGESYQIGLIEKSKPQTIYPFKYPDPFALRVDDIKGTNTGSKNHINKFNGLNFDLNIKDIRGTSAGSLKRGITTTRNLNPLKPLYQYIGNKELGNDYNLYGKSVNQTLPNKKIKPSETVKSSSQTEPNIQTSIEETNNSPVEYEKGFNSQLYKIDKVEFNQEHYKKPIPNYGLIHDQYVCSSDNLDKLANIEKQKEEKIINKTVASMSNGFSSTKYPFEKNRSNESLATNYIPTNASTQPIANMNKTSAMNMGNKGGATLNSEMAMSMNKTSAIGKFPKMSYAQKLDSFMETNKLKFI